MFQRDDKRTIVNLITDVIDDAAHLFQTEIRLIRTEINEKIARLANGGTLVAIGAVAGLAAVFLLLQAIVRWLAVAGLPDQWGYLLVGLAVAGVAATLLMKGINNVKSTNLMPDRTLDQLKADFATVKEHVQ
jgi:Putative Actinobacterial Holin-X, holin superfamily III